MLSHNKIKIKIALLGLSVFLVGLIGSFISVALPVRAYGGGAEAAAYKTMLDLGAAGDADAYDYSFMNNMIGGGGMPTYDIKADVNVQVKTIKESIFKKIEKWLGISADVMFKNALRAFLNRMAYESAVYISTGGKGAKPLFVTNFKKYLDETAGGAIGDYLNETVGKRWGKDLCAPLSPLVKLNIQIRAREMFAPPPPRCKLSQIWGRIQDLRNIRDFVEWTALQDMFTTSGSELGALFSITTGAQQAAYLDVQTKQFEKVVEGEVEPLKSKITGDIKTPGWLIERASEAALIDKPYEGLTLRTGSPAADAIGVFFNTLTYKLLQKVFKQGFNPRADVTYSEAGLWGSGVSIAAARLQYNDILKPNYNRGGEYNILQRLVCGDNLGNNEFAVDPNYCVIDEDFRLAIEQKMTVTKAVTDGRLQGNKPFGSLRGGRGQNETPATNAGLYSLRSIKILRKYRVVPVGWELAAEFIANHRPVLEKQGRDASYGQEVTLNDLIKDYNNPKSPFYRLVDPNWVLTAPTVKSVRQGASAKLQMAPQAYGTGQIYSRVNMDVDERTCLFENSDGSCQNDKYGYCTEERPIWRFRDAAECSAKYVSCQNYLKTDNSSVAYLENNLDFDGCAYDEAIGCRAYCQQLNQTEGGWECARGASERGLVYEKCADPAQCNCLNPVNHADYCLINEGGFSCTTPAGYFCTLGTYDPQAATFLTPTSSLVFLNKKAPECARESAGCQEYLQLRKASDNSLYTAQDVNSLVTLVNNIAGNATSKRDDYGTAHNYSSILLNGTRASCTPDEIGCSFYTPVSYQGPRVPGRYTPRLCPPPLGGSNCPDTEVAPGNWNDECPSQCVGFKTYRQVATNFEPAWDPLNFVYKTPPVLTCSASDEGCDQFTNLDEVASGGEGIENYKYIRQCQKPNAGCETYYTWVGSDTVGYQLKEYSLVGGANGPQVVINPGEWGECLGLDVAGVNNDVLDNPHCKEFYDRGGSVSYRIFENTVSCSVDCHPYRWTMYDANHDGNVNTADCTSAGGVVDGATGNCLFQMMASQSTACGQAGCRQYKGNGGNNIRVVLNYDFEQGGQYSDWSGGLESREATYRGGHSLKNKSGMFQLRVYGAAHPRSLGWTSGQSYEISFWAKTASGSGTMQVHTTQNNLNFGTAPIASEWQRYQLGPVVLQTNLADDPLNNIYEQLEFLGSRDYFLDNIMVTETIQSLYLVRESWDKQVQMSCVGFLNCEQYKDKDNLTRNLHSFSKICREEAVGCEALVDTHNSENVRREEYNTDNTSAIDDVIVPADNVAYVVNDPAKTCATKGCERLGLATVNYQGKYSYQTVYKVADPDDYKNSLCHLEYEMCQQYKRDGDQGNVANFKDPLDKVCEWKSNMIIGICRPPHLYGHCSMTTGTACNKDSACPAAEICVGYCQTDADCRAPWQTSNSVTCELQAKVVSGWFIKGTNIPCQDFLGFHMRSQIELCQAKESNYEYKLDNSVDCFAKSCPPELSTCTEYRDPLEPEECLINCRFAYQDDGSVQNYTNNNCEIDPLMNNTGMPGCQTYYYLENSVTSGDCRYVDPGEGCVPFYNPNLKSPDIYSKCQPGCLFQTDTISGNPIMVTEYPACQPDPTTPPTNPDARPGCVK